MHQVDNELNDLKLGEALLPGAGAVAGRRQGVVEVEEDVDLGKRRIIFSC